MSFDLAFAVTLAVIAVMAATIALFERDARKSDAKWEAIPTLYSEDELRGMYAEWRELHDAGLLDEGQPTPWSHAVHTVMTKGSTKDRVLLTMTFQEKA